MPSRASFSIATCASCGREISCTGLLGATTGTTLRIERRGEASVVDVGLPRWSGRISREVRWVGEILVEEFMRPLALTQGALAASLPASDAQVLDIATVPAGTAGEATDGGAIVLQMDGDDVVVIASKGGAPEHLNWYYNLVANPECTVEVGTDSFEAVAELPESDERNRLYEAQAAKMPQFAHADVAMTDWMPLPAR